MIRETISTRPAVIDDVPNIIQMHRALSQDRNYPAYFASSADQITQTITDETSHGMYFVADDYFLDGYRDDVDEFREIGGYVRVSKSPMSLGGNKGIIIDDLYVRPELGRDYGIGISLLARAAATALVFANDNPDRAFMRVDTANGNNDPSLLEYGGTGFEGNNTNLRLQGESIKELANRAVTTFGLHSPLRQLQ